MNDHLKHSRVNRHEKHRKNTKLINLMGLLMILLAVLLTVMIIWNPNDQKASQVNQEDENANNNLTHEVATNGHEETQIENDDEAKDHTQGNENTNEQTSKNANDHRQDEENKNEEEIHEKENQVAHEEDEEEENSEENEVEDELENDAEDDNILKTYAEDWQPVGTEQEEPHVVDYNDDSIDRLEMGRAVELATGLSEEETITWWVGNNGEQKVTVTISEFDQNKYYRVYLSWIEHEGWQPTKVEVLEDYDPEH